MNIKKLFIIVVIDLFAIILSPTLLQDFTGNSDQNSVLYHELNPPIRARYLRFLPAAHSQVLYKAFHFFNMSPRHEMT